MPSTVPSRRWPQILAWAITGFFVFGFFIHFIGMWTGPILGVWFVGTQRPWRGFLWLTAINFLLELATNLRDVSLSSPVPGLEHLAWMLRIVALGVLPFTFHRLVSPRLPGFLSTLPLPLAVVAVESLLYPQDDYLKYTLDETTQTLDERAKTQKN